MKKAKLLKTLLIPTIGITAIGTIAAVSTSCSPVVIVTGVSLDKESLALDLGDSSTLTATVHPENATDKSVTWSSSDFSVATVDNNGNVTAVGEGQATITVTTKDGGFTDTCQVTVHKKIHVIGVLLDKISLTLVIDDFETLTATVLPENATDKSVTWSSSNSKVATVDNNGKVTAISDGYAIITVTTNDGGFTDTCQVIVKQKIQVIGVWLDKESLVLVGAGDSDTLTATVLPEDATDKSVTWSSSDSSVATVDNNGNVTAVSEGSAKITVKTNDGGYEDYCDVTVTYTAASYICVFANTDSTLELKNEGGNNPNLRYSADGKNWTTYSGILNIPADERILLIGDNVNGWSQSSEKYSNFVITGNVSLYGNIMGLLDNGTGAISSIPNDYCFYGLFNKSTGIRSVISKNFLPATELTKCCYDNMFLNCSCLTVAPTLPATTLAPDCYSGMFDSCTSLSTAPDLPATILASYCYFEMFENCKSLTTAPELPATILASYCYYEMFSDCTSLTTAPDLPATTLADECYRAMFCDCSSLTKAPALPATTLAQGCYWSMFEECTSLTTAPDLPATTLASSCYESMFQGCTSLITAPALPAIDLANFCYNAMFSGCTSLRTTPDLPATTLANNCYGFMFSGCSFLIVAPPLPATTLADCCYWNMFANCTSLTIAPTLPATTLAGCCYWNMFEGCTSLVSVKLRYVLGSYESPYYAFNLWVKNVASVGTFYYYDDDPYGPEPITDPITTFGFPSGWTCERYWSK